MIYTGLTDLLTELSSKEKKAAVGKPRHMESRFCRCSYPDNWTLDTDDEEFDEDHRFCIKSPGVCLVNFNIKESSADPAVSMEKEVKDCVAQLMKEPSREEFTIWGRYKGRGALLSDNILGMQKGKLKVFSCSTTTHSFTITEVYYDDDIDKAGPGFKLIENTFTFMEKKK